MKLMISGPRRLHQCLRTILLTVLCLGLAHPLFAAAGGRKLLKLEISGDRSVAEVVVPRGYSTVSLQRFERGQGWVKVASRKVKPGVAKFKLPSSSRGTNWRAIGTFDATLNRSKFPKGFYKGTRWFGPLASGDIDKGIYYRMDSNPPGVTAGEDSAPVEADIWKTDGTHVFFFNQLRGLQVLDVSEPADPRLTASLRMPAMGEDLYLLPGSGGGKNLVLLTAHYSNDGGFTTRIRLVRLEAGKLTITHRLDVPGSLSDSRMVGNRLILATTEWNETSIVADNGGFSSKCRLTQWLVTPGQLPKAEEAFEMNGSEPVIAAGNDWLAVAVTPDNQWGVSDVSVFGLGNSGLTLLTGQPLRTAGRVPDKFKMQWRDHVLTTISEVNWQESEWAPVTVLENFRVWATAAPAPAVVTNPFLGRLQLASGESLFATRFAGNKAYVVTFLQTDPLWVVDLTDPLLPVVAGHIEVPGWSTHLEPIGNYLFSVGWESNSIAASLFDVTNAAAPRLLRRLNLGAAGSYSEAAWDEQALKVLPDAGLAMIPLTSYNETTGKSKASVQLIDLDLTAGDLALRGSISHDFDARRSDLIGSTVVSISQRALVAADIRDRDAPSILSEVALAWPVDLMLAAGSHLIHIESGTEYLQGRATARISPARQTEAILTETDLGAGIVKAAELRDGNLFILRETGSSMAAYYDSPVIDEAPVRLHLDIYRADSLPNLTKRGTSTVVVKPGYTVAGRGLVWPQAHRPCVLLQPQSAFWFGWDFPMAMARKATPDAPGDLASAASVAGGGSRLMIDPFPTATPRKAPRLLVYDIADPGSPTADAQIELGTVDTSLNGVMDAADGLVVVGASDFSSRTSGRRLPVGESIQSVHVAEVGDSGSAVVRPAIDLPGELFAITELDGDGFLAYTRRMGETDSSIFTVSASDGYDAFEIQSVSARQGAAATASGRRLFIADGGAVKRHWLTATGEFAAEADLDTGWTAQSLRVTRGVLIGATWTALFAADATSSDIEKWNFPAWTLNPDAIEVAPDGDLLVPFGAYGAERLDR